MSRNELAWVVVRSLGVITLWMLLLRLIHFLISLPLMAAVLSSAVSPNASSFANKQSVLEKTITPLLQPSLNPWHFYKMMVETNISPFIEIIAYSLLSYYLLQRGSMVHKLITRKLPTT